MSIKKKLFALGTAMLILINLCSCGQKIEKYDSENPQTTLATITHATTSKNITISDSLSEPEEKPDSIVRIVCAGDNLIHDCIYEQADARAGKKGDGKYDFSYVYQNVIDYIKDADLSVLNQETIVTDEFPPSTYPCFCSPEALGDYMIDVVGFDAVSLSNNHILDKGEKGLLATLKYWDTKHPDVIRYGAYKNTDDMNHIRVKEVNDIKFAFLGYMEHTNSIKHKAEQGSELVYLSERELETIENQIKEAKKIADIVIVSPHFGVEVSNVVTDQQKNLSKKFVEWGADIIVGTQPHTLQTCEWIEREDGTKGFVYYCLGNFVSGMTSSYAMLGGLADFTVRKNYKTGEVTIEEPKIIPMVSHFERDYTNVTIYPYSKYTEELAKVHGLSPQYREAKFTFKFLKEALEELEIPDEFMLIK